MMETEKPLGISMIAIEYVDGTTRDAMQCDANRAKRVYQQRKQH